MYVDASHVLPDNRLKEGYVGFSKSICRRDCPSVSAVALVPTWRVLHTRGQFPQERSQLAHDSFVPLLAAGAPWLTTLAPSGYPSNQTDTDPINTVCVQAVLIGFVLSVKLSLDLMDPAGGRKQPEFEVTEEDVEVR